MDQLRALVFDLQGTTVDFFRPILRMGEDINESKGCTIDWSALSARWRRLYREAMDAIIAGRRPWLRVDRIYREALDRLLAEEGLEGIFSSLERDAINDVWTRLDPWPDSIAGLERLRCRYTLATLSNAGMASAIAVVKRAGLPFDAVLTAELVHAYKPDPSVYRLAIECLDLPAASIMMVACHKYDLHAAKACGMRTGFVARPLEFGQDGRPDVAPEPDFDVNASDFLDLADRLGA